MKNKKPNGRPLKYGPEEIKWIMDNLGKISKPDMCKRFNVTNGTFRRFLSGLREKGYVIPRDLPNQPHPVGTIVTRNRKDGSARKYQKQADGKWTEVLSPNGKGRNRSTGAGDKNKRAIPKPERPTITHQQSRLFIPDTLIEKTQLLFPDGSSVICDSDKVEKVLRYLQKTG